MGLLHTGTSIFRTAALAFAWPLSVISLILSCLVAANGHWKPRAASIFSAIVSALTIVTLPLIILGKTLRLGRISSARCSRLWELLLTGLWLASWGPRETYTEVITTPVTGTNVGFSLYGHAIAPQGDSRAAIQAMGMMAGEEKNLLNGRALGRNGIRRYGTRCRVHDENRHELARNGSISASVSSISSVGSPRLASAAHPGAPVTNVGQTIPAAPVAPVTAETKV
ncbi:hypothetical protein BX661DRAFT_180121 [Kickxella alabastrina]|uniref:uncharacterized protein n=1 Tax=Kickxella alabastrina TaxID=61397 RepID=UPI00221F3C13|nr:uncharacterized protein BX661DRAFT_180121 [Kickxella alabastrina]KAI7830805.1 hypothetical protein BX661DRAFT_180121 [Kickxella alabastrina]